MMLKPSDFTLGNRLRIIISTWIILILLVILGGNLSVWKPPPISYSQDRVVQSTPSHINASSRGSVSRILKNEVEFFESLPETSGHCRKLVKLGGTSCKKWVDGDKEVCLDEHLIFPKKNCLIYSFGAGDDVTFEEYILDYSHCELHLFDPTVNASDFTDFKDKFIFHSVGVSDSETVYLSPRKNATIRYSTIDNLLHKNGHLSRTIHYLKFDIEGSEWSVLAYMIERGLLDNVWQLSMEIHSNHLKKRPYEEWLKILQRQYDILLTLEALGFRKVSYRDNINLQGFIKLPYEKNERPACGEVLYIREPSSISRDAVS